MIAFVLSFFTLIFKEIMYIVNPVFAEIFTFTSGIIFVFVVLFFLNKSKSMFFEVSPKHDMSFRHYKIKKKIPMRYLFQLAILLEERGKKFYNRLADVASNVRAKHLWQELANDKSHHKLLLETTVSGWLPRLPNKESLASFFKELRSRGLFSNPPLPDASKEDIIKYAIQQERIIADFYHSF